MPSIIVCGLSALVWLGVAEVLKEGDKASGAGPQRV